MTENEMDPSLRDAYSPEAFRAAGHRIVDMLADHMSASTSGEQPQALPWIEPEDATAHWKQLASAGMSIDDYCREILDGSVRISDPKYIGHQICHPLPAAILSGLITDAVNNGSGVYEMGMAGTAMEKHVVRTVSKQFGMDDDADGFMTSGGTLANLTAMLAARSIKSCADDWVNGTRQQLAVMVSDQSHYCIDRAVRIMGWGEAGLIRVPTDDNYRMQTSRLFGLLDEATTSGKKVIGVVGSACTTSTGSFDDLASIADFCERHGLWFHVDGAHGAAVAFSDQHRSLVAGIEKADSVALDFHKMMMTPVITSAVILRRGTDSFRTFAMEADYLFQRSDGHDWYNLAKRTFECTKTMMATKVFSILALHGSEIFGKNVDQLHDVAAQLADLIATREHFELATTPQTNIVCFRYCGPNERDENVSELNARIRAELTRAGNFYIVQTTLHGETWLRSTISNPFTSRRELVGLLDAIESAV